MEISKLDCISCGAPISVPEGVEQITCNYCGAEMAVHHNDGEDSVSGMGNNVASWNTKTKAQTFSEKRIVDNYRITRNAAKRTSGIKTIIVLFGVFFLFAAFIIAINMFEDNAEKADKIRLASLTQTVPQPTAAPKIDIASTDRASDSPPVTQPTQPPARPTATTIVPTLTAVPPIILSGNGQQATSKIKLLTGLAVFKMTHSGNGSFIVRVLDGNGNTVAWPINGWGTFDGTSAAAIRQAGTFILDVNANASWTITIDQPRVTTGMKFPGQLQGNGFQVSAIYALDKGLKVVKMSHTGKSNFIVHLLDEKGNIVEYLANGLGNFEGTKAIGIKQEGNYLFSIQADGAWTISMENQ